MIKRILGQYIGKDTIIHKLEPRLKIIFIIAFSTILIATNDYAKLFSASFLIIVVLVLSRIGISRLIKSIMPFLYLYLFIFIMYYFSSRNNIIYGLISLWKFSLLLLLSLILTSTTTLSELVKGIEKILMPLKYIKISPRNIALMLSITIRFIPSFFLYGQRVKEAQISRFSNFKKLKHIRLFINKFMNRMISSADTLSDAIEARCYDVRKRYP